MKKPVGSTRLGCGVSRVLDRTGVLSRLADSMHSVPCTVVSPTRTHGYCINTPISISPFASLWGICDVVSSMRRGEDDGTMFAVKSQKMLEF